MVEYLITLTELVCIVGVFYWVILGVTKWKSKRTLARLKSHALPPINRAVDCPMPPRLPAAQIVTTIKLVPLDNAVSERSAVTRSKRDVKRRKTPRRPAPTHARDQSTPAKRAALLLKRQKDQHTPDEPRAF